MRRLRSTRWMSKGRADRGSGRGRVRVAAWEAMGPWQLPPPFSLPPPAAPVCVGEESDGLGRQPARLPPPPPLPLAPGHVCGSGWQCVGDRLGCHEARQLPLIAPLRWLLAASTKKDQWPSRPSEGLEVGRCGSPKVGCVLAVVVCVRSRLLFVVLCVFALLRVLCLFLDEMKCNSPEFSRKKIYELPHMSSVCSISSVTKESKPSRMSRILICTS
jgi:hypothetical protein